MFTWKKAFSNSLLGLTTSLTLIATAPVSFALPLPPPNPLKNKNCEEIRTDEVQDYRKLVHKIAIYGKEDRKYTDREDTRATMRLFCKLDQKDKNGNDLEGLRTGVSLIGDSTIVLSSHTITDSATCDRFVDLSKCYVREIRKDNYEKFPLDLSTIKGKPNCIKNLNDVGGDEVRIQLDKSPRGVRPYPIGDGTQLKEGDEITVVSSHSENFSKGDYFKPMRIIQKCKVLMVELKHNRIRTDCDEGGGSSSAMVLNSRGEAVAILAGQYQRLPKSKVKALVASGANGKAGTFDGLESNKFNNYSILTIITKDSFGGGEML